MAAEQVVCGLLDTSAYIGDKSLSEWARSLTVSWLRFKYTDEILESAQINHILDRALDRGYGYCMLQAYGHIILEHWQPGDEQTDAFLESLIEEMERSARPVLTRMTGGANPGYLSFMLVNLHQYGNAGKPRYPAPFFTDNSTTQPLARRWTMVDLGFGSDRARKVLAKHRGMGILDYQSGDSAEVGPEAAAFLREIKSATQNSQRGIFLLNFEPYSDVESPPESFHGPLSALYSVAAGLKSNRILETHGFDSQTRVVVFDYSPAGLQFKRLLLEEWDGSDYPKFIRHIQHKLPPGQVHYWLWEKPDWEEMEHLWTQEVDRWGGRQNLVNHWRRYKELQHRFVICNLLDDRKALLNEIPSESNAAIWWSNAFSTIYSNWHYTLAGRKQIYSRWIAELAERAPDIYLYGADWCNISVNSVTASEYAGFCGEAGQDELTPQKICRQEIKF